jgi:hypothetical protein
MLILNLRSSNCAIAPKRRRKNTVSVLRDVESISVIDRTLLIFCKDAAQARNLLELNREIAQQFSHLKTMQFFAGGELQYGLAIAPKGLKFADNIPPRHLRS